MTSDAWIRYLSSSALAAFFISVPPVMRAEAGKMWVQVQDPYEKPVAGVEIGIKGIGDSKLTHPDGKARLELGKDTHEGDWVVLQIAHSPPGKDFVMISPWDARAQVPSFKDKAENFVQVVLVQRGDRAALTVRRVARGLAAKINDANGPKPTGDPTEEDRKANLARIARQHEFPPEDVDSAIRSLRSNSRDPQDVGLAALYERDYPRAAQQFQQSLATGEAKLAAHQEAVLADQRAVADAAFFLGESLYGQGRYREAAVAYWRCLDFTQDLVVINRATLSLQKSGNFEAAEKLARAAKAIAESAPATNNPEVANTFVNLASVLQDRADPRNFLETLQLYRNAVKIYVAAYGPGNPEGAVVLNNECLLLYQRHLYTNAEPSCKMALEINEKTPGREFGVSANLINLGLVFQGQHKYAEAEPLFRRALAMRQTIFGDNHPEVATALTDLALLLYYRKNYDEAGPLYQRALAMDKKFLGPNHPSVANDLNNFAELLEAKGDYKTAEEYYRQALAILEKALGPEHPDTKEVRANLEALLAKANKPKPQ